MPYQFISRLSSIFQQRSFQKCQLCIAGILLQLTKHSIVYFLECWTLDLDPVVMVMVAVFAISSLHDKGFTLVTCCQNCCSLSAILQIMMHFLTGSFTYQRGIKIINPKLRILCSHLSEMVIDLPCNIYWSIGDPFHQLLNCIFCVSSFFAVWSVTMYMVSISRNSQYKEVNMTLKFWWHFYNAMYFLHQSKFTMRTNYKEY